MFNKYTRFSALLEFYSLDYQLESGGMYHNAYACGTVEEMNKYIIDNKIFKFIIKRWIDKGDEYEITEYTSIYDIKST